jgi:cysteine-rich repeat protein
LPVDYAFDTDVFVERAFIESQGGSDLGNESCGNVSQVGDEGTTVSFGVGALSAAEPSDGWTFEVPTGTARLLVTLNGKNTWPNDFDLGVNAGAPPLPEEPDCLSVRFSQFEVCEIADPEPGPWYAVVSRFDGAGEYQLIVTTFSVPTSCGDGELEAGEECDDGNTEAGDCCSSTCQFEAGPCDDDVFCNGNDTCEEGSCIVHEGDPCSSEQTCDEGDDTCEPVAQCTPLTGDVDLDCAVDIVELQGCIAMFLKLTLVHPCSDPDGDGIVGIVNLQNSIAGFLRQLSCQ